MLNKYLLAIRDIFVAAVQLGEYRPILSQAGSPGSTVPTEQHSRSPRDRSTPAQIDRSLISSLCKAIIPCLYHAPGIWGKPTCQPADSI